MHRLLTPVHRLGDILLLSLRPAQLILAVSAAIIAISFFIGGPATTAPYASRVDVNACTVALLFAVYAGFSLYCSLTVRRAGYSTFIRYATAVTGLTIWTVSFVLELLVDPTPLAMLHVMPVLTEGCIIAQLMSNVRQQDRRAL